MKNVERCLRGSISILVLICHRRRLGYCDHRALRYAPRHRLNQSRFQRIPCVLSCSSREDFELLGETTGVPTIRSDISVFLSVFRVFSVIFRFVVILWTETFVILTGIVLFVILWINSESLWRCAEKTDVALGDLVLRLRGLQLLRHLVELAMMYSVNRNSEKKIKIISLPTWWNCLEPLPKQHHCRARLLWRRWLVHVWATNRAWFIVHSHRQYAFEVNAVLTLARSPGCKQCR